MAFEHPIRRYRHLYAKLLRLYSRPYYERFGKGMEQTFNDLLQERAEADRGLLGCVLWMFVETFMGILRETVPVMLKQNKSTVGVVLGSAFILLIPLVAMQFTNEVNWYLGDFVIAGILLVGIGVAFVLVMRKARNVGNIAYRIAIGLALAATLILVWMIGAVGLIGAEGNAFDLIYGGVLAVGVIGAIIARFQPRAMAYALFATALAQGLIALIVLTVIKHYTVVSPLGPILLSNGLFIALWIGSALLFLRASTTGLK